VRASSIRTYGAVATAAAALVVVAHLAYVWHGHADPEVRRSLAFAHGLALAAILGVALALGRLALRSDGEPVHPVSDVLAIAGVIAVLAHMAAVWRDDADPLHRAAQVTDHFAALVVVTAVVLLTRRLEARAQSGSNP
jgi:hypothetical protein